MVYFRHHKFVRQSQPAASSLEGGMGMLLQQRRWSSRHATSNNRHPGLPALLQGPPASLDVGEGGDRRPYTNPDGPYPSQRANLVIFCMGQGLGRVRPSRMTEDRGPGGWWKASPALVQGPPGSFAARASPSPTSNLELVEHCPLRSLFAPRCVRRRSVKIDRCLSLVRICVLSVVL